MARTSTATCARQRLNVKIMVCMMIDVTLVVEITITVVSFMTMIPTATITISVIAIIIIIFKMCLLISVHIHHHIHPHHTHWRWFRSAGAFLCHWSCTAKSEAVCVLSSACMSPNAVLNHSTEQRFASIHQVSTECDGTVSAASGFPGIWCGVSDTWGE